VRIVAYVIRYLPNEFFGVPGWFWYFVGVLVAIVLLNLYERVILPRRTGPRRRACSKEDRHIAF